jgi:hypothetical protein
MDDQISSRDLNSEPVPPAEHLRAVRGSKPPASPREKKRPGPKTPKGKARSSRNAIRFGIYATDPVIPGESRKKWEAHRAGILASAKCMNAQQTFHAERMAVISWKLNRVTKAEQAAYTRANAGEAEFDLPPSTELEKFQGTEAHLTGLYNKHEDRLEALKEQDGGEVTLPPGPQGPGAPEP